MTSEPHDSNCEMMPATGPVFVYNDVVIDHFMNPRNVGELTESDTDGFGQVAFAIPRIRFNGANVARVPNTSSMSFHGIDGESIALGLDVQGICVSTGSACSTGDPEPSHVLLAMGVSAQEAQGSIRVSLGRNTSESDITATVQALTDTVERLRRISTV